MKTNNGVQLKKIIDRGDWPCLVVLLGIGVATRVLFFSQIYLIAIDGAFQYVPVAELFAWGDYREALFQVQLPLYPWFTAVVAKLTGNFETAGQLISATTSILAVMPLFLLGRHIFGRSAAFWAGVFYLLTPEMLQRSVDVLKEGLWIFLLFWAVFLFHIFLSRRRVSWLIISLFATGLATLTRVASLVLVPVFIVWVLWYRRPPFDIRVGQRLAYLLVMIVVCAAVVIPLMMNVKEVTGQWDISKKTVTMQSLIESVLFDRTERSGEKAMGAWDLVRKLVKVYHPVLFLLMLAGVLARKPIPRDHAGELYLVSCSGAYLSIIAMIMWTTQRYLFFPILLSYLWAGAGAVALQHVAITKLRSEPSRVIAVFSALVFLMFLPILVQPQRVEKIERKAIGLWIKSREMGQPQILTDNVRIAYYAGGHVIRIGPYDYRQYSLEARSHGIDYVIAEKADIRRHYPELPELIERDFELLEPPRADRAGQSEYLVYKVREPPD